MKKTHTPHEPLKLRLTNSVKTPKRENQHQLEGIIG